MKKREPPAVDEAKVKARVAGRKAAETVLGLAREEAEALPKASRRAFWKTLRDACQAEAPPKKPQKPKPPPPPKATRRQRAAIEREELFDDPEDENLGWETQQGLQQIKGIVEAIDGISDETRERDDDGFLEDVRENVLGVAETIRRLDTVTANQQRALDNWEAGVQRWVENDHGA